MSNALDNFAALILTHGRPDHVHTFKSLRRSGYTGPIYFIIDSEDNSGDEYRENFGAENVIVFNKEEVAKTFDTATTESDMMGSVYARNASFEIAKGLGLDYFIQLDDDYTSFMHRFPFNGKLGSKQMRYLDRVFTGMIGLLEDTGALSVAMSQGGDHLGGIAGGHYYKGITRKAMNSFVYATDRPVTFVGKLNEDVNTYVTLGSRGQLFFTAMKIQLVQAATQTSEGGLSDTYKDSGTYVKSFYTVMMHPSSVKVSTMGGVNRRYHHNVSWSHTVPKILSPKYKKTDKGAGL